MHSRFKFIISFLAFSFPVFLIRKFHFFFVINVLFQDVSINAIDVRHIVDSCKITVTNDNRIAVYFFVHFRTVYKFSHQLYCQVSK